MILHDKNLSRLKTKEERIKYIRSIEGYLIRKYNIVNRDEAIQFEDFRNENYLRFNFEPYGVLSLNLIHDYWEIETTWKYSSYFAYEDSPSALPEIFYEIARDLGFEDAYICETYFVDKVQHLPFDEWISECGEIPEITRETVFPDFGSSYISIYHESFQNEKGIKGYSTNNM